MAIEAALSAYDRALFVVSHNEHFLQNIGIAQPASLSLWPYRDRHRYSVTDHVLGGGFREAALSRDDDKGPKVVQALALHL